ncbi:MAG: protein FxsA [Thermoleophilaceae bacterium]|nr:protein FxsA [Thermoleophilaceae bacterium]MEA2435602.1 protein FxsA [Thermoleophilaceae bacterium]
MPLLALIALFVLVPLAELYVIFKVVGPAIGAPLTIALLAADSLAGAWLMKSQGRAVWRRFNETMAAGRIPHREIVDGVLIIFGGAFLITPGFITDILGFLLLIPPTRSLFRRSLQRRIERRSVGAVSGRYQRTTRDYDVEGTATEHGEPGPPPPSAELPPPARSRRPRA